MNIATIDTLKDYVKDEPSGELIMYSSTDPVINLLNYYQIGFDWKKKNGYDKLKFKDYKDKYDEFRLKYDVDSRYYSIVCNDPKLALHADTIISFYTPYKTALKRVTGKTFHKYDNPFDELITNRNKPGFKEVNDKFSDFAAWYHTRGNFMLLPCRNMNADRYKHSQDRIDKSLYECFPGGKLAKYFGKCAEEQEANLREWIKAQNLDIMFYDGIIERNKIIPFNKNNPFVSYENMTIEELFEFIENAEDFVIKRR